MVAPPLLAGPFIIFIDSRWIIERIMIFRSWPLPGKLCVVNHQGWSSLIHLFNPKRFF